MSSNVCCKPFTIRAMISVSIENILVRRSRAFSYIKQKSSNISFNSCIAYTCSQAIHFQPNQTYLFNFYLSEFAFYIKKMLTIAANCLQRFRLVQLNKTNLSMSFNFNIDQSMNFR